MVYIFGCTKQDKAHFPSILLSYNILTYKTKHIILSFLAKLRDISVVMSCFLILCLVFVLLVRVCTSLIYSIVSFVLFVL